MLLIRSYAGDCWGYNVQRKLERTVACCRQSLWSTWGWGWTWSCSWSASSWCSLSWSWCSGGPGAGTTSRWSDNYTPVNTLQSVSTRLQCKHKMWVWSYLLQFKKNAFYQNLAKCKHIIIVYLVFYLFHEYKSWLHQKHFSFNKKPIQASPGQIYLLYTSMKTKYV